MITIIYTILNEVLNLYKWAVIIAALFGMLVSFGVLDTRNRSSTPSTPPRTSTASTPSTPAASPTACPASSPAPPSAP